MAATFPQTEFTVQFQTDTRPNPQEQTGLFYSLSTQTSAFFLVMINNPLKTRDITVNVTHVTSFLEYHVPRSVATLVFVLFQILVSVCSGLWLAGRAAKPPGCVSRRRELTNALTSCILEKWTSRKWPVIQYDSLRTSQPAEQTHRLLSVHGPAASEGEDKNQDSLGITF